MTQAVVDTLPDTFSGLYTVSQVMVRLTPGCSAASNSNKISDTANLPLALPPVIEPRRRRPPAAAPGRVCCWVARLPAVLPPVVGSAIHTTLVGDKRGLDESYRALYWCESSYPFATAQLCGPITQCISVSLLDLNCVSPD